MGEVDRENYWRGKVLKMSNSSAVARTEVDELALQRLESQFVLAHWSDTAAVAPLQCKHLIAEHYCQSR